jgi:DNA-binding CsgD family transcriptional regulator
MNIGQRRDEVVRMAKEGRSVREIAQFFDRSVVAIYRDLKIMGVPTSGSINRISIETKRKVDERLKQGVRNRSIEMEFGLPGSYVSLRRRKLGLKVRYRSPPEVVARRRAIVPVMVAQELSEDAIAEALNVRRQSIAQDKRITNSFMRCFRKSIDISVADLDAWIAQGKSLKELARHRGVEFGRLMYAVNKLGWVRPGPSRPIPEELRGVLPSLCGPERIQGLIDEGHSIGEIARHLGLSRQGLSAYCRRKKLKTRPVFNGRRSRAMATPCGSPDSSYA